MGTASLLLYVAALGQLPPTGTAVLNDDYRQPPPAARADRYERYQLEPARSGEQPIRVPADTAPPRSSSPTNLVPAEDAPPSVTTASAPTPNRATQLLTEALAVPAENALPGRPLALVDLLTLGLDRPQQLVATRSYWSLATAVTRYHYRQQEHQFIDELSQQLSSPAAGESSAVRSALAAARAREHEAELAALAAQHELASQLAWAPGEPLPLPIEVPHAGTYRTQFDLLFAGRPAPSEARKIDRTLPIHYREIDARAAAVQAAEDALEGSWDAWARDEAPLETVLDCLTRLEQQRTSMLVTVERYNHNIAQYALAVAPLGLNEQELAAMLIRRRGAEGLQFVPQADEAANQGHADTIERAGFESPGWTSPRNPALVAPAASQAPSFETPSTGEPTLAEPRLLSQDEPGLTSPRAIQDFDSPATSEPPSQTPTNPFRNSSPVAPSRRR